MKGEREKHTLIKRGRPALSNKKRQEMRDKITAATRRLFQKEGFRQISMRRIAREVGCSPMALYQYYDSKIDILHTLWADVFDAVFHKLEEMDLDSVPREKHLERLAFTYVAYWLENPEHYRLVFMIEGINQPEVSVFLDDPTTLMRFQLFTRALIAAIPTELSVDEMRLKLDSLICFLHGIAHNLITISGYHWPSHRDLVQIAVNGVTQR